MLKHLTYLSIKQITYEFLFNLTYIARSFVNSESNFARSVFGVHYKMNKN